MAFWTLRVRTFMFMLLNILFAFVLTGVFSLYHFQEEYENYHSERLERKESAMISHLDYVTKPFQGLHLSAEDWRDTLAGVVDEISTIHHLDLALYHPSGERIAGTELFSSAEGSVFPARVEPRLHDGMSVGMGRKVREFKDENYILSTSELLGRNNEVELIVVIPYFIEMSKIPDQDYEFLSQLVMLYVFLLIVGVVLAYVLSNYITANVKVIGQKLQSVRLNKSNEKIDYRYNDELGQLVQEYNKMVEKLEQTAVELAKSERESAWKEMAQQVAHEIKNPLTPMKLTLQMMERSKDLEDVQEMSRHLLEEVESLTHIAEAFSRFAQMPGLVLEAADLNALTERAARLYSEQGVKYAGGQHVTSRVDKEQWARIVHNLVKNAMQSVPADRTPDVRVYMGRDEKWAVLQVKDNGVGIPPAMRARVFEPNFSTKSSGMGLGLAMVKNLVLSFGGSIDFETGAQGTTFTIKVPLIEPKTEG